MNVPSASSPVLSPCRPRRPLWLGALAVGLLAASLAAPGCTGSESVDPPGTGSGGSGNTGSGGASPQGSGGKNASGGASGSGGSGITGSGGTTGNGGSGGSKPDSGAPTDGGNDAGGDAGEMVLTYSKDIGYQLFQSCGGCHLSDSRMGGFDLKMMNDLDTGPTAYAAITASVSADHAGCPRLDATKKRVVPGKPDNSLLYIKVSMANPPSGCGGHMPNGASITTNQIAQIRTWIMQGAKP